MEARITLRLPAADAGRLERLAATNRHSLGAEVRAAIARHLDRADRERAVAAMTDAQLDALLLATLPSCDGRQPARTAAVEPDDQDVEREPA